MESNSYFTYVVHLERKKSTSFQGPRIKCASSKIILLSALLDWAITLVPNLSSSDHVDFINFLDFGPL